MMLPHRAAEHLEALQTAVLRILASVAIIGVRLANQIGQHDSESDPSPPHK
jgi:hypothetical protein